MSTTTTTIKPSKRNIGTIGTIKVTKELEHIIDTLHSQIGSFEWSGVLFYNLVNGSIKKLKDLEFEAKFLYPLNIGSTAYTEFEFSGDLMDAYDIKEDLIECESGLLHTHHNMGAFFSGTDIDELVSNAGQFNYYISMVVDFKKEYVCKIIFPSKSITNKTYNITNEKGELVAVKTKDVSTEYLEGDLDIVFENVAEEIPWLNDRIDKLQAEKKVKTAIKSIQKPAWKSPNQNPIGGSTRAYMSNQNTLFDDYPDSWGMDYGMTQQIARQEVKASATSKSFLSAILNLDKTKVNDDIELILKDVVALDEADSKIYTDAISINLEIMYAHLYPEDAMFEYFFSKCGQAANILDEYPQFDDSRTVEIIKTLLT